jgi:hypothetical protein
MTVNGFENAGLGGVYEFVAELDYEDPEDYEGSNERR